MLISSTIRSPSFCLAVKTRSNVRSVTCVGATISWEVVMVAMKSCTLLDLQVSTRTWKSPSTISHGERPHWLPQAGIPLCRKFILWGWYTCRICTHQHQAEAVERSALPFLFVRAPKMACFMQVFKTQKAALHSIRPLVHLAQNGQHRLAVVLQGLPQ